MPFMKKRGQAWKKKQGHAHLYVKDEKSSLHIVYLSRFFSNFNAISHTFKLQHVMLIEY